MKIDILNNISIEISNLSLVNLYVHKFLRIYIQTIHPN